MREKVLRRQGIQSIRPVQANTADTAFGAAGTIKAPIQKRGWYRTYSTVSAKSWMMDNGFFNSQEWRASGCLSATVLLGTSNHSERKI